MGQKPLPPPRLSLLQASRAPIAVIFRRGPSKWVEVVKWDLTSDTFELGQWFHGRIYDSRSDLSPNGELLVYFVSKFTRESLNDREYTYAWTAVSRPPWLTALALWPKGDCWHGGGLFLDNKRLWLNHRPEVAEPHPAHKPKGLRVEPNPEAHGEDEPIYTRRLDRDGWDLEQQWETEYVAIYRGFQTIAPDIRVKRSPTDQQVSIRLTRRIDGYDYREHFQIEGANGEPELPPGDVEWLDWDPNGRLIALADGKVWVAHVDNRTVQPFRELLDLRDHKPENRVVPESARHW